MFQRAQQDCSLFVPTGADELRAKRGPSFREDAFGNFGPARIVCARRKGPLIFTPPKVIPAKGLVVPRFIVDKRSLVMSCIHIDVDDWRILSLEEDMRRVQKPKGDWLMQELQTVTGRFSHNQPNLQYPSYARSDAEFTKRLVDLWAFLPKTTIDSVNIVSVKKRGRQKGEKIVRFDVDYKEIELRLLAQISEDDQQRSGLFLEELVQRNFQETCICTPKTWKKLPVPQPPAIFRPSPKTSSFSGIKDSVIPRLLADSASKKPLWPGG